MDLKDLNNKIDNEKPHITYDVAKSIIDCLLQLSKELEDLKRKYKVQEAEKTLNELIKRQDAVRKQNKELINTRSVLKKQLQEDLHNAYYDYNADGWF